MLNTYRIQTKTFNIQQNTHYETLVWFYNL